MKQVLQNLVLDDWRKYEAEYWIVVKFSLIITIFYVYMWTQFLFKPIWNWIRPFNISIVYFI